MDFFQGWTKGLFLNFSRGAKSVKICFFPLETKKTTFFDKNFKIQGALAPLPPLAPLPHFRRP